VGHLHLTLLGLHRQGQVHRSRAGSPQGSRDERSRAACASPDTCAQVDTVPPAHPQCQESSPRPDAAPISPAFRSGSLEAAGTWVGFWRGKAPGQRRSPSVLPVGKGARPSGAAGDALALSPPPLLHCQMERLARHASPASGGWIRAAIKVVL